MQWVAQLDVLPYIRVGQGLGGPVSSASRRSCTVSLAAVPIPKGNESPRSK